MGSTALNFIDAMTGQPKPEVFEHSAVHASSHGLGWDGVVLENGESDRFEPDGVAVAGHFVVMNTGPTTVDVEIKNGRTFQRNSLPPGTLFLQPAGVPMVQRNCCYIRWSALEIPSLWADRVLGQDLNISPMCGLADDRLTQVMQCLMTELDSGCPSGPLYSDALAVAFAARLARVLGMNDASVAQGSLGEERLNAVQAHVDAALARRLTVAKLASIAGMSDAHFSREFKRTTGLTPHAYIMTRRLEQARRLLIAGKTICEAAVSTGFADQAHLTRMFRNRYGVTPGAFQRAAKG